MNTEDTAGEEGGSIRVATDHNTTDTYEYNVVYVVDTDDTDHDDGTDLIALFVDVNNELDGITGDPVNRN